MKTRSSRQFSRSFAALVFAVLAAGCSQSLGDATDADDTGPSNATDVDPTGGGGEWQPCSAANACPDGQFCFNGLCALGCNSNGDCADDQYCATDGDRLCHNKEVSTCPDTPCAEGQVCVNGLCSTPAPQTSCQPDPAGQDGCDSNAVCIEDPAKPGATKCYTFPYCGEDGTCPVGTIGAVCNAGIIPNKDEICLTSLCQTAEHCPAAWKCVAFDGAPVGYCSSGTAGEFCNTGADCVSGTCDEPEPGFGGVCA